MRFPSFFVLAAGCALAAAACGPRPGTDAAAPDSGGGGTDAAATDGGLSADAAPVYAPVDETWACPPAPPTLGAPGDFAVDTADVVWRYSPGEDVSWAPFLYYTVPADAVSLAVTVEHGAELTGLAHLRLGAVRLVDWNAFDDTGWGGDPFYHWPAPVGTLVMPMDDASDPAPGCLAILPLVDEVDVAGTVGRVHVVTRRLAAALDLVDLNVLIREGAGITEGEAAQVVQRIDEVLAASAVARVGNVTYATVPGSAYVPTFGPEIDALRATVAPGADPRAVNLFFIADFSDEAGTLGFAGGIPGPMGLPGTASSGVVLSVDSHRDGALGVDLTLMGETTAHEIAHQLGLFHTTEPDGLAFDYFEDTPECPSVYDTDNDGYVSAEECAALDGPNLMFWISALSFEQVDLSPTQVYVLNASPVIR